MQLRSNSRQPQLPPLSLPPPLLLLLPLLLPPLLLLLPLPAGSSSSAADVRRLRALAASGSKELHRKFHAESHWEDVRQAYEQLRRDSGFSVVRTEAVQEVKHLAARLGSLVSKKMRALQESVRYAEQVARNHTNNPSITEATADFINAKTLRESDPRMQYDRTFLQKVVANKSSVHIPTEIFNGDVGILNGIAWSSGLDRIFIQNKRRDPELLWQFFGSQNGFFRMFPGMKWRTPKNILDMYDVRRRPWYTQGSTSPKDMLFLIDTSGSMHGQSLTLTKKAVKHMIDTLGENDFIAVAQYPGKLVSPDRTAKPHLVQDRGPANSTCFRTFVQATKRNKDRLFRQIDDMEAYGIVNFNEALQFAYRQFEQFHNQSVNNQGAMCNSIIMIFTDGDVGGDFDTTRQLLQSWKLRTETVHRIRTFTYSVGQHQNTIQPLVEVACDNRGFFAEIPAMGAVTKQVQHITTVLNRPMTLYEAEYYQWHNIYLDSLGLGLMTSLTVPVYNTSGNQSFLGLMGTDITVKDMQSMVPHHKLGPNGYAFAINANGYIVYHPELRAQNGWLRDPPNVDLIEVEFDSQQKREVRRRIISSTGPDGRSATPAAATIATFLKIPDEVHTYQAQRTYAFTNVNRTMFGISVVLPPSGNWYANFSDSLKVSLKASPAAAAAAAAASNISLLVSDSRQPWLPKQRAMHPHRLVAYLVPSRMPYCREYYIPPSPAKTQRQQQPPPPPTPPSSAKSRWNRTRGSKSSRMEEPKQQQQQQEEQVERIRNSPASMANLLQTLLHNRSICHDHWVRAIAIDMLLYEKIFTGIARTFGASDSASVFATGLSGLMGVHPAGQVDAYSPWREGWFEGYYQRAFDRPDVIFASVVPFRTGEVIRPIIPTVDPVAVAFGIQTEPATVPVSVLGQTERKDPPPVTLFQAVRLRDGFKVAVSGVTLSWKWISETIFNKTFSRLCDLRFVNNTCYLLEDGGYIVSSNEEFEVIGHFLGHVDKPLMRHLVFNLSVFGREREYDYQGSCPKERKKSTKSGANLVPKLLHLLPTALSLLLQWPAPLVQTLRTLHTAALLLPAAVAQESTSAVNQNQSCIKLGFRYFRPSLSQPQAEESFSSSDSLGRKVTVLFLNGTNLLLVAVSRPPYVTDPRLMAKAATGRLDFDELRRETQKDEGPDLCTQEPRFRMRPNTCYNWHPQEDVSDCGKSGQLTAASGQQRQLLLSLSQLALVAFTVGIG